MVELRAKIEEIDRRLENENDSTYREQKTEVEDQVQMLLEEARVREEEVNELQVCSLTKEMTSCDKERCPSESSTPKATAAKWLPG